MIRYALRAGEYLAIDPSVVRHDEAGFFLMLGDATPENETHGTVCVVNVRGALVHFDAGGGDSYEAIINRTKAGLEADPKPSAVLFRIDSPGGVVAGLNECVMKLQRMSKESGVPFVAYIDEMAASAAYALTCACVESLAPPSAVVGSIGCISTMATQVSKDAKDGLEFRLITSGKRKADGHPHQAITDDAVKAETARNAELASQFFALAGKARGIAPAKLESLEAAIYLGKEAKRVGLIDDVMSFDDALYGLDKSETPPPPNPKSGEGNVTDRRAKELDKPTAVVSTLTQPPDIICQATHEAKMAVKLDALIKKTEASLASEADAGKRIALQAKLTAFAATRAEMDDDEEPEKKDDDEDDDKAAKHAENARKMKAKAAALGHRAKAAEHKSKAAEAEEEAKKCEEEARGAEEEGGDEAHTVVAPTNALTPGAAAAIAAQGEMGRAAMARIEKLEQAASARELNAMIEEARAQRRITPGEAKTLGKKAPSFVRDFLEMRPKALVATTEDTLEQPDGTPEGDIPANVKAFIEQGIQASGLTGEKADMYRKTSVEAHRKAMSKTNGVY